MNSTVKSISLLLFVFTLFYSCLNISEKVDRAQKKYQQKSKIDINKAELGLNEIVKKADNIKGLKSLLISKNGRLISESYFENYSRDSLDHVRSVTKSVIGLLTGIAIDKGFIESIDAPMITYLNNVKDIRAQHQEITIRHLLTMTSGIKWDESNAKQFNELVTSSDPVAYVLNQKVVSEPGKMFQYNSGVTHLLSVVLTNATGMSTLEFAHRYLFEPINIKSIRWGKIGKYYNGGADLELKPRDMLKIGHLINDNGKYNGVQIVPKDWIQASTQKQIQVDQNKQYGYLWWISPELPEANAIALGYRGQFIINFPEIESTIVGTSIWKNINTSTDGTIPEFLQLAANDIYPFLKQ